MYYIWSQSEVSTAHVRRKNVRFSYVSTYGKKIPHICIRKKLYDLFIVRTWKRFVQKIIKLKKIIEKTKKFW